MNDLLPYLLKSTLCISLLYLAFRMVMRKETFFALNRVLLLTVVTCSIFIPLVNMPQGIQPEIQEKLMPAFPVIENQMPEYTVVAAPPKISGTANVEAEKPDRAFPVMQIFGYIYLAGMLIPLLILIHGFVTLLLLYRKAEFHEREGYKLFILEKDIPAFSFRRMIFISRSDYNDHGATILAHEQQHIRLGHFYDLLLMEMAKIIHWFNPIIYWLIQDLKAIHEYQADQHTLNKGINATKYQLLIIEKGVGPQRLALANSFNHCQIKKRITMMNKQSTGKAWRWKVATFLPLLALLLMAFGRTGENVQKDSPSEKGIVNQEKTIAIESATQSKDSIYSKVEVMPQFPGGDRAIQKFLNENIKYPKEAEAKHIQGKVFVNFIINNEGKVTNPKIVKSENPALDAEALRVISIMPQWIPAKERGKPVRISYTIPINFVLSPEPSELTKENLTSTTSTDSSPIMGTWKLAAYSYGGTWDELKPVSPGSERIKFIAEKNFNWVQYLGNDKIVTGSAGGTYTFSGDDYTEKIEFGGQGMASYIGKEHKFKVSIHKDKMEMSGNLADGLNIKEVWVRYQPSDKTTMNESSTTSPYIDRMFIYLMTDGKFRYNSDQTQLNAIEVEEKLKSELLRNPKLIIEVLIEEGKIDERVNQLKEILNKNGNPEVNYSHLHIKKGEIDSNGNQSAVWISKPIDIK